MGTLGDLKGCYSIHELKETGSTSSELKAAGATMNELKTGFDLMELKDAGFTVRDLKGCWNMRDLKRAGISCGYQIPEKSLTRQHSGNVLARQDTRLRTLKSMSPSGSGIAAIGIIATPPRLWAALRGSVAAAIS